MGEIRDRRREREKKERKRSNEVNSGRHICFSPVPLCLTFPHSPGAGNSGLRQEHHDHPLHRGNHRRWPLQHPLSSCTSVHTCSTCLYEDRNIPLNSNKNFHLDPQQNTTWKHKLEKKLTLQFECQNVKLIFKNKLHNAKYIS